MIWNRYVPLQKDRNERAYEKAQIIFVNSSAFFTS